MNIRNEKGSITMFVLVGLLFMTSFLIISYGININKSKVAKEQFNIISGIYSHGDGDASAYERAYTALRKQNKQNLTASVEDSSILELTRTFEEEISNYTIYGSSQEVGDNTKNILETYGFSATNISTPTSNRVLTNSYGTTISTTDFENSLTITQSTAPSSNIANYTNGYFVMGMNNAEGNYILSFDIAIKDNPLNATNMLILNQGGGTSVNNQYITLPSGTTGRVSVELQYLYHTTNTTRRYLEFRCMGMSFTMSNIMLTEIGETTEYEPIGKYKIPVQVRGKNLFNKTTIQNGYINDVNGNFVSSNLYYASDYIAVPAGEKIYITKQESANWCAFYDENKEYVSGMTGYGLYTVPSNARYLRITVNKNYIDIMQVEINSAQTEYEYVEPQIYNIYLNEKLKDGEYIDFKKQKLVKSDGTKEDIDVPELSAYEDNTVVSVLTEIVPSKIEVEYVGYTLE